MNHSQDAAIWVVIQKVKSPNPGIKYGEALDEALCFGWIDGKMKRFKFPIRTTPEGSIDPYGGKPEADMSKIEEPMFFNQMNGCRVGDPSELIAK